LQPEANGLRVKAANILDPEAVGLRLFAPNGGGVLDL